MQSKHTISNPLTWCDMVDAVQRMVLTGGGTAGHVMPHVAMIPTFQQHGFQLSYMGSYHGIERQLMQKLGIPYTPILTGKLRRHISWRNMVMPIKVIVGICQAFVHMGCHRPKVVFSKGGFVALPVVIAAWLWRIPVVAHESDLTPGLANRLCMPFVKKLCVGFQITQEKSRHPQKTIWTGTPVRPQLKEGQANRGLALTGFDRSQPIVMIMGGSLGSHAINQAIEQQLDDLLAAYQVIHIVGGKHTKMLPHRKGYKAFAFVDDELADLIACTDCVISRAGANSLAELVALQKPHVLIPLPKKVSRGDQLQNAAYTKSLGLSLVLLQADMQEALIPSIQQCLQQKEKLIEAMSAYTEVDTINIIMRVIEEVTA